MTGGGDEVIRGAPRFVAGKAGEPGALAFVPEIRVRQVDLASGEVAYEVVPVAIIELHDSGVTRYEVADPNHATIKRLRGAAIVVGLACMLARALVGRGRGE